ncbi:nuclear transport factor 2 family protein [Elioraea rosea]|uniref:nuclear transport factor 2 family protein n=1 Tax=Elioraea rosea TaxID=2492390 RepID=UPI0011870334|nr:nuclear transport factor 2 family protein [Elioraea rosea]
MPIIPGLYDNLAIIRRWYATRDPALLDEAVDWVMADGFPVGGHYRGSRTVLEVWWPKLMAVFSEWRAAPERFLSAGEAVVTLGRYDATVRHSGERLSVPFTHVWWLRHGRIAGLEQQTDTALIARALAGRLSLAA